VNLKSINFFLFYVTVSLLLTLDFIYVNYVYIRADAYQCHIVTVTAV